MNQIEQTTDFSGGSRDKTLAAMFLLGLALFLTLPAAKTAVYFFSAPYYLLPFGVLALISKIAEHLKKHSVSLTAWASASTFFCFGCFEVIYSWLPDTASWITPDSPDAAFWRGMISYGGNRSLQIIPIALLALIMAFKLKNLWRHRLKIGDISADTGILGEKQPMPWKRVCLRISFYFALVTVGFLATKGFGSWNAGHAILLSTRLTGGAANSLVEELLFRGLLQPVFGIVVTPGVANILQAVFFSVIHYGFIETLSFSEVFPELIKLILYFGIGLFLGRAARETDGLLIPWFIHFIITSAIWLTLSQR
ncbi:MAG: CPBP family intramembrane metalloprotease [Candidatus Riflebacteria bacterium]|nr:CPBP family intramembrane metalloprotease [Candidatus Riflebacteria bacterium]